MPIYKDDKKGTWYFAFRKVINGKTYNVKRRGFKSKIEAKIEEIKAIEKLYNPNYEFEHITFDELFEKYIADASTKLKISTITDHKRLYYRFNEQLGKKAASEITPNDLLKWKTNIIGDCTRTEGYCNRVIFTYKNIVKFGIAKGYITNLKLLDELKRAKLNQVKNERKVWTIEQVDTFLNTFDLTNSEEADLYWYFKCLFISSCRPNEFRCLQKQDIKSNHLSITKNITNKVAKGKETILTTKNKGSIRDVVMPDYIIDYLNERTKDYEATDFIFGKSKPISENVIRKALNNHIKIAQLEPIVIYGFRHSSATHMLRSGLVPLKVVSKRLGHTNTSTTINTYIHLFKEDEDLALLSFQSLKKEEI